MSGLVCDCWLVRHVNLSGWIGRTYLSSLLLINSGAVVEIFIGSCEISTNLEWRRGGEQQMMGTVKNNFGWISWVRSEPAIN